MKKDFQKWHSKKASIHESENRPGFHEREVWWCALGVNVGFEQDGGGKDFLRPVIVFKKFNKEIFWGIPLTNTKKDTEFYFQFTIFQLSAGDKDKDLKKIPSAAILSQMRLIDASRLSHKLGDIASVDFETLTKKFKALLP
ncbi:MAG: type II toxin-antitoxin system PemK/MazF family toxin [Candidatus Taylorbacteria bacterium]|nr:type II toxin-antitoxin system PemK/MazF family toxin [Candidatus Taylorbacteria bacterium]